MTMSELRRVPPAIRRYGKACVLALAPALAFCVAGHAAPPAQPPRQHVRAALEAMGGGTRWRTMEGMRLEGIGHTHHLEQSERFEGPFLVSYEQFSELRDLQRQRVRRFAERRDWNFARFTGSTVVVADSVAARLVRTGTGGQGWAPAPGPVRSDALERLALSPDRVLLAALDAPDLRAERDTVLFGVRHHRVSFDHRGGEVTLYLNADTRLPSMLETRLAYTDDFFWNVWGDVTRRTTYNHWSLEPGGFRYPRQWNTTWEEKPVSTVFLTRVEMDAAVPADSFALSEAVRAAYRSSLAHVRTPKSIDIGEFWGGGRPKPPIEELKPGLVLVPGGYYVMLVRQPDGIVIVEAPYSAEYTQKILAEVERRFPGERVKAVISTGDAWTYVGGVREYAARGIPIHSLALNRPMLERLLTSPRRLDPDALARSPRRPQLRWVDGRSVIGTGPNRIEIHPVRGAGGERMMLVYFPEHRLLWSSDLVQRPSRDGSFFMPQYLSEVASVVERESLQVETVAGMHLAPLPWGRVVGGIEQVMRAESRASPPGSGSSTW